MLSVLIITIGVMACVALLVFKGITITVHRTYKDQTPPQPIAATNQLTKEEWDKLAKEQEQIVTFDKAVKAIQDAIGGVLDDK